MPEEVFLDLVKQYQAQIYQHALYLLNSPDDAKDVTQETFIKAWNSNTELRLETVQSWLLKCANNLCIDLLRRRRFQVPLTMGDTEEIETLVHHQRAGTAVAIRDKDRDDPVSASAYVRVLCSFSRI